MADDEKGAGRRVVRYVGTAHARGYNLADLRAMGVTGAAAGRPIWWKRANGWTVPVEQIPPEVMPYIEADPALVVVDPDAKPSKNDPAPPAVVESPSPMPGGTLHEKPA